MTCGSTSRQTSGTRARVHSRARRIAISPREETARTSASGSSKERASGIPLRVATERFEDAIAESERERFGVRGIGPIALDEILVTVGGMKATEPDEAGRTIAYDGRPRRIVESARLHPLPGELPPGVRVSTFAPERTGRASP